jgi:hypothetical protein
MSSKPTTAMSSGTRMPRSASVRSAPIAIWSFAQTSASGSSPPAASIARVPSRPDMTLNSPVKLPVSVVPGLASMTAAMASRRSVASGAVAGPPMWNKRRLP